MNSRSVAIFAVVVAILVGASIYFLNSDYAFHAPPKPTTDTRPPTSAGAPPPTFTPAPSPRTTRVQPNDLGPKTAKTPTPPSSPEMTRDEKTIDDILNLPNDNSDEGNTKIAQRLIAALPSMGADGQVECISHINNLLPDDHYNLLLPIWRNPNSNADVLDSIETELMNKEDKVKLPMLLEAVKMPNHPSHDSAKDTLQVFLDEDYGDNMGKWDQAVKAYLKKEADEEAGIAPN